MTLSEEEENCCCGRNPPQRWMPFGQGVAAFRQFSWLGALLIWQNWFWCGNEGFKSWAQRGLCPLRESDLAGAHPRASHETHCGAGWVWRAVCASTSAPGSKELRLAVVVLIVLITY